MAKNPRKITKLVVGGIPIKVIEVPRSDIEGALGTTNYAGGTIEIIEKGTVINGEPIPEERWNQVLWHEIVHYIFLSINEEEDSDDEKKVDNFAQYLVQFHKEVMEKIDGVK